MDERNEAPAPPRYRWPWFVLALVLGGMALAALWLTAEARRLHSLRDPNPLFDHVSPPPASTNHAAFAATNSARPDLIAKYRDALHGGDAVAGRKVFFEKPEANCGKCHKIGGQGGETGPPLDGIGARQTREYILESMISPNCRTLAGYETVIVLLKNGSGFAGLLKSETETELVINAGDEGMITVRKSDIQTRQKGLSPMPEGLGQILAPQDLRDVVEFVANLKN